MFGSGPERKEASERHSVIFALMKNGRIQLEERRELDKWFGLTIIPGGHIEEGETQKGAVIREIREEYGKEVTVVGLERLGMITDIGKDWRPHYKHVHLIDWMGNLSNPEGRNKHIEASLTEARRLCTHPISQLALDMIERKLSR